jgi:hypothetical protein
MKKYTFSNPDKNKNIKYENNSIFLKHYKIQTLSFNIKLVYQSVTILQVLKGSSEI